jgi:xylulokinase
MAQAAFAVPAGNDGLMLIPFFEGERTPNAPDGTGVYFGLRDKTFSIGHFARAAMEGATLGLNYGLNRLRELGITPREIRATGGGSKSAVWRQIRGSGGRRGCSGLVGVSQTLRQTGKRRESL